MKSDYPGRGIHNVGFYKSLKNGNLKKMLCVVSDHLDLDVQIRKDYLNIYYRGGSIAKIMSENSIKFDEFYFYFNHETNSRKKIKEDCPYIVESLIKERNELINKFRNKDYDGYFLNAKKIMDKWLDANPKPEREEQHQLTQNNKFNESDYTIIDLEYQVSILSKFACTFIPIGKDKPKEPRFDIIAINKHGKLCVIELKKGTGALKNSSGLKEHWDCYQQSINRNHVPFMDEMKRVLKQKIEFNLINKQLVIKSDKPEFMFAFAYDEKTTKEQQDKIFQKEVSIINEPIHVIRSQKDSYKLMDI